MVTLGVRSSTYEEGGGHIHPIIEIFLSLNLVMEQYNLQFSSVQFSSSVVSNSLQPHEVNHSMPGLPVHHQLLESTQTHVH